MYTHSRWCATVCPIRWIRVSEKRTERASNAQEARRVCGRRARSPHTSHSHSQIHTQTHTNARAYDARIRWLLSFFRVFPVPLLAVSFDTHTRPYAAVWIFFYSILFLNAMCSYEAIRDINAAACVCLCHVYISVCAVSLFVYLHCSPSSLCIYRLEIYIYESAIYACMRLLCSFVNLVFGMRTLYTTVSVTQNENGMAYMNLWYCFIHYTHTQTLFSPFSIHFRCKLK